MLRRALETERFAVLEASSRRDALKAFDETQVDLVTLDLKLGQTDGLQLAREMRAIRNVPLVMITGKDRQIDRIVGLEHGADDYIVKPFNLRETMLRIQSVLRRYAEPLVPSEESWQASAARIRAFNHYVLDLVKRELRSTDGDLIDLTDAEFRLLVLFVENPARVLSRDELARRFWGAIGRRSTARSTGTSLGSDASSRDRPTSRGSSRACGPSVTFSPAKCRRAEGARESCGRADAPAPFVNKVCSG